MWNSGSLGSFEVLVYSGHQLYVSGCDYDRTNKDGDNDYSAFSGGIQACLTKAGDRAFAITRAVSLVIDRNLYASVPHQVHTRIILKSQCALLTPGIQAETYEEAFEISSKVWWKTER